MVRCACATRTFGFLAILLVVCLWFGHLDTPWNRVLGFADWIGAQNARIATNMDRIGLADGRGVQLLNLEEPETPAAGLGSSTTDIRRRSTSRPVCSFD